MLNQAVSQAIAHLTELILELFAAVRPEHCLSLETSQHHHSTLIESCLRTRVLVRVDRSGLAWVIIELGLIGDAEASSLIAVYPDEYIADSVAEKMQGDGVTSLMVGGSDQLPGFMHFASRNHLRGSCRSAHAALPMD